MKNSLFLAIALSCVVLLSVKAQETSQVETGRYDKSIEDAAKKRAAEKIGTLRGLIEDDRRDNFVTPQDLSRPAFEAPQIPYSTYRKAWQKAPGENSLPPMVRNQEVDPVVTGEPFKFNSKGEPLGHHQEYPRPTPFSAIGSLFEALKLNPYPGDE